MKSHNGQQLIEVSEVGDPEPGLHISDLIKAATDAYYALRPDSGARDSALTIMQPHQQRVVSEKSELDEKRTKLSAFFDTPIYQSLPDAEKERLVRQLSCMTEYSEILGERIAAF